MPMYNNFPQGAPPTATGGNDDDDYLDDEVYQNIGQTRFYQIAHYQ